MKRTSIAILLGFVTMPAASEDYCPEVYSYTDRHSDEGEIGNYEFGYTSGYRETAQGDYQFIYCISNLSDQTPFEFKWKGPRPSTLLKGKVAYGFSYTEGWQPSSTPPDEREERTLSLGNRGSFTDVDIETIFKQARNEQHARLHQAQDTAATLNLASWSRFLSDLQRSPPASGAFRRFSGVTFDIPSDPGEWEAFIESSDEMPASPPTRVRVFFGVEYSLETLTVNLVQGVGFAENSPPSSGLDAFFSAFRLDFPALDETGFESDGASSFNGDQALTQIGIIPSTGAAVIGVRQTTQIGSLEPYLSDDRPVRKVDVPVTLSLNDQPIFEFPVELLGRPDSL